MKAQLMGRLEELRYELETGQKTQALLENQLVTLRRKIIYISGAVRVLEEELEKVAPPPYLEEE